MNQPSKQLFKDLQQSYNSLITQVSELSGSLDQEPSLMQLADVGYMAREAEKLANEVKKKLSALHIKAQKVLCLRCLNAEQVEAVETDYCKATPDIKQKATPPTLKREPEAFKELMESLGVDPEYCIEFEAVKPNYNGLNDLVTELTALGKPLPKGLSPGKVFDDYIVSYRRKKGVLD